MAESDKQGVAGYRLPAPAKLNLYLHIIGRRDDGYHRLDSLVAFAEIGDCLDVTPADRLSLEVTGRFSGSLGDTGIDDNLVMRAARLLKQEAGLGPSVGAAISLDKRLPVAAGLGGGSADAAAALRGLCALWAISPDADDLARMALSLGADVPACLALRPVFVGGIGEVLDPGPDVSALHVVLVNPAVALSTASVFAALTVKDAVRDGRFSEAPRDAAALAAALSTRGNDLEAPARALCPVIGDVLAALGRQADCRLARMSGSGATCFGLFDSAAVADHAARAITDQQPDWWVVSAALLGVADKVVVSPISNYM